MGGTTFNSIKPVLASTMKGSGVKQVRGFKSLEEQKFDSISMGTRPSGTLHLGNLFVLASCMHYLRINSKAQVHVDIMDLDFDTQRGALFTPFVNLPATRDFIKQLEAAVDILSHELKVDPGGVKIRYFSDRLKGADSELRNMLLRLAKGRESVKALKYSILDMPHRYDTPPLSMICDGCHQSNSNFVRYHSKSGLFTAKCDNWTCTTGEYSSDLSTDFFNVHYLVDPVRDLLLPPPVLHVYGGDYGLSNGQSDTVRFMRVAAVMEAARICLGLETEAPSFFIAPLITDHHGKKISKTESNGTPLIGGLADHLKKEIEHVLRLIGLCIDGTLEGFNLVCSPDGEPCEE
jgi:hypothetical protein